MRIEKWISIEQSVEVDLTSDDIMDIIDRDSDSLQNVLWGLNNIATFLKGISDDKIAEMSSEQRKFISNFLLTEAKRYPEDVENEKENSSKMVE